MSTPRLATLLAQEYNQYVKKEQQITEEEMEKYLHKGLSLVILGITTWKAVSKILEESPSDETCPPLP